MKRYILTSEEMEGLENALMRYGNVLTFDQLSRFFDEDRQYTRVRINKLVKQGWLKRIKKGVFVVSDLSSRGSLAISHKAIVNYLVKDAYISFETALQHYGMYDQLLNNITAISLKQYKSTRIDRITYNFIKTQHRYYYGWETHNVDGQSVKISSIEKALIDLIQFHRTRYSVDLVLSVLGEYRSDINVVRLNDYALRANLTTRRILGFLMDIVDLETIRILESTEGRTSISSVNNSSHQVFKNKWKLYYDSYFEKYVNE